MSDDKLMSDEELEAISKLAYGGGKGDPQRDVRRLLMHIDACLAARATAEQRDSVIEECALIVEQHQETFTTMSGGEEERHLTTRRHGNQMGMAYANAIRALKSQQDAAIPFRPWYEILDALKTDPKLLADIEQAVAASKASIAQLERERTVTRDQLNTPLDAAIESQRSGDGS